jgi:benzoate-CoA ligase family protein
MTIGGDGPGAKDGLLQPDGPAVPVGLRATDGSAGAFNAAAWLVDRQLAAGRGRAVALRCGDDEVTYGELARGIDRTVNGLRASGVDAGGRVLMVVNDEPAFVMAFLAGLRMGAVPVPVSTMLRADDVAALAADCGCVAAVVSERYRGSVPVIVAAAPELRVVCVVDAPPTTSPAPVAAAAPGAAGVAVGGAPAPDRLDPGTSTPGKPAPGLPAPETPAAGAPVPALVAWSSWTDTTPTAPAATDATTAGFWLYTSGTTGRPKGAVHRHGDIRAVVESYAEGVLAIGPDDVCYSVPKLFFAFGLGNALLFPLAVGATAVIDPEPATPGRAAALLARHRPTLWFAPPGLCAALVDSGADRDVLTSVRAVVTAGEAFPAETLRRFTERFGVEVLDGIGSTEALHIFCSNRPGDVTPGTSGRPVPGYELRLLDDYDVEIDGPDVPGALWIRGPSIAAGYWRRPVETAATFVDGWLRTGDVYSRTADGCWRFVGRNSDMIKAGGIWVSPAEVENVLLAHGDVLEAAVVGGRDGSGLETTVAFVVPRRDTTIDPDDLAAHCRREMAAFKRPRRIHVVDELPKTATGKIQRFALRAALAGPTAGEDGSPTAAPTTAAPTTAAPVTTVAAGR